MRSHLTLLYSCTRLYIKVCTQNEACKKTVKGYVSYKSSRFFFFLNNLCVVIVEQMIIRVV